MFFSMSRHCITMNKVPGNNLDSIDQVCAQDDVTVVVCKLLTYCRLTKGAHPPLWWTIGMDDLLKDYSNNAPFLPMCSCTITIDV